MKDWVADVLFHGMCLVFRKLKVLPGLDEKEFAFKISLSHEKNEGVGENKI